MTETQNANRPGALIAMSGGVDSSVAAWLMQQKGYACTGITMRLTRNETLGQSGFHTCCSEKDIEDAAEVLGIAPGAAKTALCRARKRLRVILLEDA